VRARAAAGPVPPHFVSVLSLWKLRVGSEAYYLSRVASGLEDYYSGEGEAAGRWVGNAAAALGLTGEVDGEDLQALLAGLAPGTGLTPNGGVLRAWRGRVPGFDLTFSVPKSVSVVYALGDPLVQQALVEACEQAVAEALAWLEREACFVRRGSNNRAARVTNPDHWGTRRLTGQGFVAAQFRHRASRAGDPQLHWHVLVGNMACGVDGRWSALDGTALYRTKRVAGAVFQACLRREVTRALGVEWLPVTDDVAEIAGIPRRLCRQFSKRRAEIEAELDRLGQSGPVAAQAATLATRAPAQLLDGASLLGSWRTEASWLGWGADELDRLLTGASQERPGSGPVPEVGSSFVERVVGSLTETDGIFTRHQVSQAVAALLAPDCDPSAIDATTALVLADEELIPLGRRTAPSVGWEETYTTRSLLGAEECLIARLTNGLHAGRGILSASTIQRVVTAGELGADQLQTVRAIASQGHAVEVLIGRAGTGKTSTVATVAHLYRAAGWEVVGVAPSARAARELEEHTGIVASTIPRFHHRCQQTPMHDRVLVIVDEAGMADTFDLAAVLAAAADAGAKLILVGDPCQLPEIGPGGGLAAAIDVLGGSVCELTANRRQHEQWEIDALDQLRDGDPLAAWQAFVDHGRVTQTLDARTARRHAVEDWWVSHRARKRSVLLAGTRAEVAALNQLARRRLAAEGQLTAEPLAAAGREYQVGDRVLCTRNDDHQTTPDGLPAAVDNGTLATIVGVDIRQRTIDVEVLGTGRRLRLTAGYLESGAVEHGYALTVHKSQGATFDQVFVVGPAGLYREAAYVALSRARLGTRIYATSAQVAELDHTDHSTGIPLDDPTPPADVVVDRLHRTGAKALVSLQVPDALTVDALARRPLDELDALHLRATDVERSARQRGLTDPSTAGRFYDAAVHARYRLAPGRRVRALDWANVGIVKALDDMRGTATVDFTNPYTGTATRHLPWSQLLPIDAVDEVPLTPAAQQHLAKLAAATGDIERAWAEDLRGSCVSPQDREWAGAAMELRQRRLTERMQAKPPEWLLGWLGPRPTDPVGAATHDDAVTRIATWRDRHHLTADVPLLGPTPAEPHTAWHDETAALTEVASWLRGRMPEPTKVEQMPRTQTEIDERRQHLEEILATAPPASADRRTDRQQWILTNWPYVVEHHELDRLDPPTPTPLDPAAVAIHRLLDRLAPTISPPAQPEPRSLAELAAALTHLDPGRHQRALMTKLVTITDRLAHLEHEPATPAADQVDRATDDLRAQRATLRTELAAERQRLSDRRSMRTDDASVLDRAQCAADGHPLAPHHRPATGLARPVAHRAARGRPPHPARRPRHRRRHRRDRAVPRPLADHQPRPDRTPTRTAHRATRPVATSRQARWPHPARSAGTLDRHRRPALTHTQQP
jgi:conjugative relaxase-like TrwC/TraI family protein